MSIREPFRLAFIERLGYKVTIEAVTPDDDGTLLAAKAG